MARKKKRITTQSPPRQQSFRLPAWAHTLLDEHAAQRSGTTKTTALLDLLWLGGAAAGYAMINARGESR